MLATFTIIKIGGERRERDVLHRSDVGRWYLLRIHRPAYHTRAEVVDELRWLDDLRESGLTVRFVVDSKWATMSEALQRLPVLNVAMALGLVWASRVAARTGPYPHSLHSS